MRSPSVLHAKDYSSPEKLDAVRALRNPAEIRRILSETLDQIRQQLVAQKYKSILFEKLKQNVYRELYPRCADQNPDAYLRNSFFFLPFTVHVPRGADCQPARYFSDWRERLKQLQHDEYEHSFLGLFLKIMRGPQGLFLAVEGYFDGPHHFDSYAKDISRESIPLSWLSLKRSNGLHHENVLSAFVGLRDEWLVPFSEFLTYEEIIGAYEQLHRFLSPQTDVRPSSQADCPADGIRLRFPSENPVPIQVIREWIRVNARFVLSPESAPAQPPASKGQEVRHFPDEIKDRISKASSSSPGSLSPAPPSPDVRGSKSHRTFTVTIHAVDPDQPVASPHISDPLPHSVVHVSRSDDSPAKSQDYFPRVDRRNFSNSQQVHFPPSPEGSPFPSPRPTISPTRKSSTPPSPDSKPKTTESRETIAQGDLCMLDPDSPIAQSKIQSDPILEFMPYRALEQSDEEDGISFFCPLFNSRGKEIKQGVPSWTMKKMTHEDNAIRFPELAAGIYDVLTTSTVSTRRAYASKAAHAAVKQFMDRYASAPEEERLDFNRIRERMSAWIGYAAELKRINTPSYKPKDPEESKDELEAILGFTSAPLPESPKD